MVSLWMILSDIERLSEIFNDTKRARSLCDSWASCKVKGHSIWPLGLREIAVSCLTWVTFSLYKFELCVVSGITVWTVVQTVLTATFNSYGDSQISTPHKINTPEPIDKKFGTIDYVREGTSYTKFGRNSFTGGFWANGWNITKIIFIYLFINVENFHRSLTTVVRAQNDTPKTANITDTIFDRTLV